MRGRARWVLWCGGCWLLSSVAHAQCTKDVDCKGDRICEDGKCTSPTPPPDSAAAPSSTTPPTPAEAPPAPAAESAPRAEPLIPVPIPTPSEAQADVATLAATAPLGEDEPAMRRRSKGAMAGGIVLLSVAPIALIGALVAKNSQDQCDEDLQRQYPGHILPSSERYRAELCDDYSTSVYVLGIGGAVMAVAGIPLLIYGAPKVPNEKAARFRVDPWATAQSGGVRLRWAL